MIQQGNKQFKQILKSSAENKSMDGFTVYETKKLLKIADVNSDSHRVFGVKGLNVKQMAFFKTWSSIAIVFEE